MRVAVVRIDQGLSRSEEMEDQEAPKVATIAISCKDGFANLLAAATTEDCCAKDFLRDRDIQQMQERYTQWAGNLGALQHFKSPLSLEHRLRDAPLVRDSLLNTLTDLHDSIQAGRNPSTRIFNWLTLFSN
jgi:hypothetical protein